MSAWGSAWGISWGSAWGDSGAPVAAPLPLSDGGSGRYDEDRLWEYIEALKASFAPAKEELVEEVVEQLEEATQAYEEIQAEVVLVEQAISSLYADLEGIAASTSSLEAKWAAMQRVAEQFEEMQEEEDVVKLLFEIVIED